jgi:hypothetical protein
MPLEEMQALVGHAEAGTPCQSLTIHNISGAVLVIPWRIIDVISFDGGVRWKRQ